MKKVDLTKGNVLKVLITLALPIMGSSLLQFSYNLVDMLWVGGLGSNAVAVVGAASLFIGLGNSINALIVIGTGIKVSHALGKNDDTESRDYIDSGIILNLIIATLYSIILIVFGKDFIGFLNIDNLQVRNESYWFLVVSAPTMFFSFFTMLYTRIFNSYGDNKSALKISAMGIIINIILDPIFIYTFKLGVIGAGLATLVATIAMFIAFNIKSKGLFKIKRINIKFNNIISIAKLGLPMSFQRVLFTFVNIYLGRIIGIFGAEAIAAQKIGFQIEAIIFMVVGGLNGSIASFVGQNYGAKQFERIKEGYKKAVGIGILYAAIVSAVFIIFSQELARCFVKDIKTVSIASDYLKVIGFSQIFSTTEMISNGVFTGLGLPKISATISIVFTLLRIPLAMIFIKFIGVNGVWLSISISSILKGSAAYLVYKFKVREGIENVKFDKVI